VSLGTQLQLERERRQVSLRSVAERTRVPERFLMALEQEQFEQLPGGDFNSGILRSYCSDLGLDEGEWLARFEAAWLPQPGVHGAEFPAGVESTRTRPGGGAGVRWGGVLLMLLVLGALAWAAWKYVVQPRVLR
jgi:cytoskeletal protein RodZ